jgi:glycopeptide antibiotics resistance protein
MAVLPLNSASPTLNHTFMVRIRLDYLLHSILFIPCVFLYIIAFKPSNLKAKLIMIVTGLLMAFATEGVQYFLSYRAYNINDLLANCKPPATSILCS